MVLARDRVASPPCWLGKSGCYSSFSSTPPLRTPFCPTPPPCSELESKMVLARSKWNAFARHKRPVLQAIVNLTTYQVKREWVDTKVRCKINWTGNVSRSMRWSAPWSTEQAAWREEHSGTIYTGSLRGSTRHATSMWWSALVCPQFLPGIVSTNLACRRSFLASG